MAFKLMVWSWKLSDAQRGRLNTRQFIRRYLIQLGIGAKFESLVRGGMRRWIVSVEEVLALCRELRVPAGEVVSLATHQG